MMRITENHLYRQGYILLPNIQLSGLPEELAVEGYRITRKSEFHISLVDVKGLAQLLDLANFDRASKDLVDDFIEFSKTHDLVDFTFTKEFRLARVGDRVSLVIMVDFPDVKEFYRYLSSKYQINFPALPTHITLYTNSDKGIGLSSMDELATRSVRVSLPQLDGRRFTN